MKMKTYVLMTPSSTLQREFGTITEAREWAKEVCTHGINAGNGELSEIVDGVCERMWRINTVKHVNHTDEGTSVWYTATVRRMF